MGRKAALSERPDIILMDLEMPNVDGWEATRRLKGSPQTRDIPIIAMQRPTGTPSALLRKPQRPRWRPSIPDMIATASSPPPKMMARAKSPTRASPTPLASSTTRNPQAA